MRSRGPIREANKCRDEPKCPSNVFRLWSLADAGDGSIVCNPDE